MMKEENNNLVNEEVESASNEQVETAEENVPTNEKEKKSFWTKWLPAPLGYSLFFGSLFVAIGLGLIICLL